MKLRSPTIVVVSGLLTASTPAWAQYPPAPMPPPPMYPTAPPYAGAHGPRAAPAWAPQTELRSVGAVVGGSVALVAGTAMSVFGVLQMVLGPAYCWDGGHCQSAVALGTGMTVGGVLSIGGGIALIVWGAHKVPVRPPPLPTWVGAPGGAGWQWKF